MDLFDQSSDAAEIDGEPIDVHQEPRTVRGLLYQGDSKQGPTLSDHGALVGAEFLDDVLGVRVTTQIVYNQREGRWGIRDRQVTAGHART